MTKTSPASSGFPAFGNRLNYLIERENEEMFRTSVRNITFPDGETRRVEAYRLIWTWYDRSIAYTYGATETELLNLTLECAAEEKLSLGEALGCVLDYVVHGGESQGLDYTDDVLELLVAKRAVDTFYKNKKAT